MEGQRTDRWMDNVGSWHTTCHWGGSATVEVSWTRRIDSK